jgi:hypothetical protein
VIRNLEQVIINNIFSVHNAFVNRKYTQTNLFAPRAFQLVPQMPVLGEDHALETRVQVSKLNVVFHFLRVERAIEIK